jgi:hypothetical protein
VIDSGTIIPTVQPAFRLLPASPRVRSLSPGQPHLYLDGDVVEPTRSVRRADPAEIRWQPTRKLDEPAAEDARQAKRQYRIGFLKGRISVPDDFDTMGQDEIEAMFGV